MRKFIAGTGWHRGMTLMEVLAAIFIIGMGLIMVGAAFPVGTDQVMRMKDETEAALCARSAIEYVRSQCYFRNMTTAEFANFKTPATYGALPVGGNSATSNEFWRIWNPQRAAYSLTGDTYTDGDEWSDGAGGLYTEQKLWGADGPASGDLLWRAFYTRVGSGSDAPLFKVTIVVVKYSSDQAKRELYDPRTAGTGGSDPRLVTAPNVPTGCRISNPITLVSGSPKSLKVTCTGTVDQTGKNNISTDRGIFVGDYIMEPQSGTCYKVNWVHEKNPELELATTPDPPFPSGKSCLIFRNVVGVYYTFIAN